MQPMSSKAYHSCLIAISAAASLVLASCASGPTYAEAKSTFPALKKGQGRVFVYRPSAFGAAIKPTVKINDAAVGQSQGQGFLYSDQSPGTHQVTIGTEWTHKATVTVKEGESTFVRCKVTPGLVAAHVIPSQVDRARGESEIEECKLSAQ